jgi:hypothetical protein
MMLAVRKHTQEATATSSSLSPCLGYVCMYVCHLWLNPPSHACTSHRQASRALQPYGLTHTPSLTLSSSSFSTAGSLSLAPVKKFLMLARLSFWRSRTWGVQGGR